MKNIHKILFSLLFIASFSLFTDRAHAQCGDCLSVKETTDWITGKVKEHGNFVYYFRGENTISKASFTTKGNRCTWEYRFSEKYYDAPEKGKGSKPKSYIVKFKLKDITEVVMVPVEGNYQTKTVDLYYSLEFRTFNDKDKIVQRKSYERKDRTNEVAILIADKDVAERMVVALNCSLCNCNKGDVKEEGY